MSTQNPRPASQATEQANPAGNDLTDPSCMPIEMCFEELETIVSSLEDQTTSLEESIALFERGMKLSKRCSGELGRIEKKIKLIIENSRGETQEQDFDTDSGEDSASD